MAMDSQITLVNPAPPVPYYLSSADLTNAVIYSEPAVPLYRVTSDARHIKIYDSTTSNRLIAVLYRRDIFCDMISFPSRCGSDRGNGRNSLGAGAAKRVSIRQWLRRFKLPDGKPAFTVNTAYGPYIWKTTSKHRVKVFADYDLDNPVASCYLHRSIPPSHPALVLQSTGESLRDDIVVAYLVQRYRMMLESKTLELFVGSRPR